MTLSETAQLLALCAAFDSRTVGEADVYAWQSVLNDVDFEVGKDAVRAYYATRRERIMPSDINAHATALHAAKRAEQQRRQQFEQRPRLALAPAAGSFGQRAISEPGQWYVQARETLERLRAERVAARGDAS